MPKTLKSVVEHLSCLYSKLFPITIILFFVALFPLISFYAAETPQEVLNSGREALPAHWDAGVMSGGSYYRWFTVSNHPYLFGFFITLFLGAWFLMIATAASRKFILSEEPE